MTKKHQKGKQKRRLFERSETPTDDDGFPTSSSCSASSPAFSCEGPAPPTCVDDAYTYESRSATSRHRIGSSSGGGAGSGGVGGDERHGGSSWKVEANANASGRSDSQSKDSSGNNGSQCSDKDHPHWPAGNSAKWDTLAAPKMHLYEGIAGLFEDNEHAIGRTYTEAALEHWRGLTVASKAKILSGVSREDVYDSLREVEITTQFPVEGEPREETARKVAEQFLHAMEVTDGVFKFPHAPTLEFVGFFACLETNLLMSMEESKIKNEAAMVLFLLLWRQSWWLYGFVPLLLLLLLENKWCTTMRAWVWEGMWHGFCGRRRWQPYVRWKVEAYMVAALSIVMSSQERKRWYYLSVILTVAAVFLDYQSASTRSGMVDSTTLVNTRQLLLHLQKFLLLLLAYPRYIDFLSIGFYYFPTVFILVLSSIYFLVGFGIQLFWRLVRVKVMSRFPKWRDGLDAWWQEGRDGLNRAVVMALVAILVIPYTFYKSWYTVPAWRGSFWRILSVLVVTNLASVEDLQRTYSAAKEGTSTILYRARRWIRKMMAFSDKARREKAASEA
ncbi:Hypothetical protein NocV09_00502130 [Nannochloropsis oceanica]